MTGWKKTRYIALLLCATWLLMLQMVYCVFGISSARTNPVPLDFFDLLGYIAILLSVIVSLFTISTTISKLKQLRVESTD
jgi:hypothetical protein